LGSVTFTPRWWSAGFVALAPLYWLPLLSTLLAWRALSQPREVQFFCGYVIATLCWGSIPSKEDWRIAIRYPAGTFVLLTAAVLWLRLLLEKG